MSTRLDLASLTTRIVGPTAPAATCVLMHGFGASGDDLVPLADVLDGPVRYAFPAAPLSLGGLYGDSRAWWMIDLANLEADRMRDRSKDVPKGLPEARAAVLAMLDELEARHPGMASRLVIGGFSQGAMLALDVALHRPTPPAGLILMSGTLIAEAEWAPRLASLANVPVVLSHGRQDAILPYRMAEVLRDRLTAAGARVDWKPFYGGHEIPGEVIDAAAALLRGVATASAG